MVTLTFKKIHVVIAALALLAVVLGACTPSTGAVNNQLEHQQQDAGLKAIIQNQPIPDLGGYSFPRQVVIETYIALNKPTATWTYIMDIAGGQLTELCPSYGYPIPGGTELSNPQQITYNRTTDGVTSDWGVIANPEPNGLYPPNTSAGTLVNCVNKDGTVSPVYVEPYVVAFPYRVNSDRQITRTDQSQPSIAIKPSSPAPPPVAPTTAP